MKTLIEKLCKSCGQDDIRARMKEDESLVDLMAPMTSTVASTVDSLVAPLDVSLVALVASMVASMGASMVASMASMASMVEALDWLQWMTAESKSDDERFDGWTHNIREGRVDGLTTRIDGERADGLTHKIREELTDGLTFLDGVVQVVTWARTKRVESLVDSMALMTRIASTVALMVASMVATMAPVASMVASMAPLVASMASVASMVEALDWLQWMTAESKSDDERVDGWTQKIREGLNLGQDEKGRIIGGLDGTDDADSLDCGADGGFDGGYDGGNDGFEPKQRNENCKRRSRGSQKKKNARMGDDAMDHQWH